MKCFVHEDKEAVAVCKECGKAMCSDCSSFGMHSGVCPECLLPMLKDEKQATAIKIFFRILFAVIAIVFPFIILSMSNSYWVLAILIIALILICSLPKQFQFYRYLKQKIIQLEITLTQGKNDI